MTDRLFTVQPTGTGWPDYITAISDPSSIAQAVYFDSVAGYAGTNYPVGTKSAPVNNVTDLITICTARNIRKVVLINSATILQFIGALSGIDFSGEGVGGLTPTVDFNGQAIGCTFNNLRITDTTGSNLVSVSEFKNCDILTVIAHTVGGANYHGCKFANATVNPPLGIINLYDDCECLGDFSNTTGRINVWGKWHVGGTMANTTGIIMIYGRCEMRFNMNNTSGTIATYGNCQIRGRLYNTTGTIYIFGDCHIGDNILQDGAGFINIYGDCQLRGNIETSNAGNFYVSGDCKISGHIIQDNTGHIAIYGKCQIGANIYNAHALSHCTIMFTAPNPTLSLELSATSITGRIVSRGSLTVTQMVAGATAIIDLSGGTLTIAASCTGGVIDLYGDCALVDLAGGAVTVNDHRVPGHA